MGHATHLWRAFHHFLSSNFLTSALLLWLSLNHSNHALAQGRRCVSLWLQHQESLVDPRPWNKQWHICQKVPYGYLRIWGILKCTESILNVSMVCESTGKHITDIHCCYRTMNQPEYGFFCVHMCLIDCELDRLYVMMWGNYSAYCVE